MKYSGVKNKNTLKAAIITMSFVQMATNAVASILADIADMFPEASPSAIQYLMTFPNLLVVAVSLFAAGISRLLGKRTMAAIGLFMVCLAGILSFLFHGNLVLLYVWAGILGVGIGLVIPVANALISEYFEGADQTAMFGFQTSAANIGSMVMTFFGGLLAVISWNWNYLVYLIAAIGLVCVLLFVPKEDVVLKAQKRKTKIPGRTIGYIAIAAVFMMMFYVGPTNLAMIMQEGKLGSAAAAGTAATILLLGGTLMGLGFVRLAGWLDKNTIGVGFLVMAAGYLLIFLANSPVWIYMGSFLAGTSNSLVLPQCMGQATRGADKSANTLLVSLVFAFANLGTFMAPVITTASRLVMGNELAASRFLFTGVAAVVAAVVLELWLNRKSK